jgi:hypothetical protein
MIKFKVKIAIFVYSLQISFLYEVCSRYKCDGDMEKDICGRIKIGHSQQTQESYKEYHLFPCANHKQKCQVSTLTDINDARCVERDHDQLAEVKLKK